MLRAAWEKVGKIDRGIWGHDKFCWSVLSFPYVVPISLHT